MRRALKLTFGMVLLTDGSSALWRFGFHQGRFFAAASVLIALAGVLLIIAAGRSG